jgi:hypothetical protein
MPVPPSDSESGSIGVPVDEARVIAMIRASRAQTSRPFDDMADEERIEKKVENVVAYQISKGLMAAFITVCGAFLTLGVVVVSMSLSGVHEKLDALKSAGQTADERLDRHEKMIDSVTFEIGSIKSHNTRQDTRMDATSEYLDTLHSWDKDFHEWQKTRSPK